MVKKLVLINPVNPQKTGLTVNMSSRFPPLSLAIVAALTPPDWDVKIIDENFEPFTYVDADLVGLTAFTASVRRAYEIAGFYREKGIPTVLGGIHASMLPEEALHYVDAVVIGEAESTWGNVIADFESGRMKRIYQGKRRDLA
ncbi:MAG: cobalamin B12-binding domain-containing protein, partial [Theionarchaea archaeon]|nr:cobalamin B12-binding domain-containing protein [Theionarchaea archaeon]